MAHKKGENILDTLKRFSEEWDKNNTLLRTVYKVDEVRPAYNTGGYYDTDVPEMRTQVSPTYDTPEECEEWISEHEPEEYHHFEITKWEEYERVTTSKHWRRVGNWKS